MFGARCNPILEGDERHYFKKMKEILESFPNKGPPSAPSRLLRHLYIGSLRNAEDLNTLERLGITHVLNVAGTRNFDLTRSPYPKSAGIKEYLMIPAEDHDDYNISQHFFEANAFINRAKLKGGKALVHCNLGVNRCAALCCAYILSEERLPILETIKLLKSKRAVVLCNKGFRRQVLRYAIARGLIEPTTNDRPTTYHSLPRYFSLSSARSTYNTERHQPNGITNSIKEVAELDKKNNNTVKNDKNNENKNGNVITNGEVNGESNGSEKQDENDKENKENKNEQKHENGEDKENESKKDKNKDKKNDENKKDDVENKENIPQDIPLETKITTPDGEVLTNGHVDSEELEDAEVAALINRVPKKSRFLSRDSTLYTPNIDLPEDAPAPSRSYGKRYNRSNTDMGTVFGRPFSPNEPDPTPSRCLSPNITAYQRSHTADIERTDSRCLSPIYDNVPNVNQNEDDYQPYLSSR